MLAVKIYSAKSAFTFSPEADPVPQRYQPFKLQLSFVSFCTFRSVTRDLRRPISAVGDATAFAFSCALVGNGRTAREPFPRTRPSTPRKRLDRPQAGPDTALFVKRRNSWWWKVMVVVVGGGTFRLAPGRHFPMSGSWPQVPVS